MFIYDVSIALADLQAEKALLEAKLAAVDAVLAAETTVKKPSLKKKRLIARK